MLVFHSETHRLRDAKTELSGGRLIRPLECPERVDFVLQSLRSRKNFQPQFQTPRSVTPAEILSVHSPDYLRFLSTAWSDWHAAGFEGEALPNVWPSRSMPSARIPHQIEGKLGYFALSGETSITATTYEAALGAVSLALSGADAVLSGAPSAFALCRPPGHHAATDQFGGYCFLNNAAIAAESWIQRGLKRVAILDVDFHHGNGTQQIFYDRSDVLFCSIHGDPIEAYPHFLGHADETGRGKGAGYNFNCPLPRGTAYPAWALALTQCLDRMRAHQPEALLVSLGVDTFENDPISFFKLKNDDYTDLGARIASLALPTLFVLEGGYAIKEIGENTVNVLAGFENAHRPQLGSGQQTP